MYEVMVFYFDVNSQVVEKTIRVGAQSKQEAADKAVAIYENKKTPAGLKLAGAVAW